MAIQALTTIGVLAAGAYITYQSCMKGNSVTKFTDEQKQEISGLLSSLPKELATTLFKDLKSINDSEKYGYFGKGTLNSFSASCFHNSNYAVQELDPLQLDQTKNLLRTLPTVKVANKVFNSLDKVNMAAGFKYFFYTDCGKLKTAANGPRFTAEAGAAAAATPSGAAGASGAGAAGGAAGAVAASPKYQSLADKHGGILPFYHRKKCPETAFLGNCHRVDLPIMVENLPLLVENLSANTAEALFQASKFPHNSNLQQKICQMGGGDASIEARENSAQCRGDWHKDSKAPGYKVKDLVMLEILKAKFAPGSDLANDLLATGELPLVEHFPHKPKGGDPKVVDTHWADGGDGTGENMLGKLLMIVRCHLGGPGVVTIRADWPDFATAPNIW